MYGGLDILISNAAVNPVFGPTEDVSFCNYIKRDELDSVCKLLWFHLVCHTIFYLSNLEQFIIMAFLIFEQFSNLRIKIKMKKLQKVTNFSKRKQYTCV